MSLSLISTHPTPFLLGDPSGDALTATGLPAVARTAGVSLDSALVLVAAMLAGIAGPDASIDSPLGPVRLAKLDLLTRKEDLNLQKFIDRIVSPLESMNRRLAQNMGRNSPLALELLTSGFYSSPSTAKLANPDMREKSLRFHLDQLAMPLDSGSSELLHRDLSYDPASQRMESILHPQFVLKGVAASCLKSLVEDCHLRTALVVQPQLGLDRARFQSAKVTKILTDLLNGVTITKRPASSERGRDSSLQAKAHIVLALGKAEIDALHGSDNEVLNQFLLIPEGRGQKRESADARFIQTFFNAYQRVITEILTLRRDARRLMVGFEMGEGMNKFEETLWQYESSISGEWAEAKAWAMGLPQTLFWALRLLTREMPVPCRPAEEDLMKFAFATAWGLVENHVGQVLQITNAALVAERQALAVMIVNKITQSSLPIKLREIVRACNNQKKARFDRVIESLVGTLVLVREEDGSFSLGPVDLADVEDVLTQMFALA